MLSQDAGFFFQSTRPCSTIFYSLRHFTSGKRTKQIVVVGMARRNVLNCELQQNSRTFWSFREACFLPSACTAKHKWKNLALLNYFSSYVFHSNGRQGDVAFWAKLCLYWRFVWIMPETRNMCTWKRPEQWTVIGEGTVIYSLWRLVAGWSRYSLQVDWFLFLKHRRDEVEKNSKRLLLCSIDFSSYISLCIIIIIIIIIIIVSFIFVSTKWHLCCCLHVNKYPPNLIIIIILLSMRRWLLQRAFRLL